MKRNFKRNGRSTVYDIKIQIDKTDFLLFKKLLSCIYPLPVSITRISSNSYRTVSIIFSFSFERFFTMNSESESSLDTDQHFNENISGTKKRTKGSRARTRSGSTTSKTDCDPSDNPQSEVATMKQVRTKRNWKKKKKKETNEPRQKIKRTTSTCANTRRLIVVACTIRIVIELKFRCKSAI